MTKKLEKVNNNLYSSIRQHCCPVNNISFRFIYSKQAVASERRLDSKSTVPKFFQTATFAMSSRENIMHRGFLPGEQNYHLLSLKTMLNVYLLQSETEIFLITLILLAFLLRDMYPFFCNANRCANTVEVFTDSSSAIS